MSEPSIIVAGHSHITSLGVALKSASGKEELAPLKIPGFDTFAGLSGKWPREESYWDELCKLAPGKRIALSWQGNQHMLRFIFAPQPDIDFVYSGNPGLPVDENAVLVPELAIKELFRPSINGVEPLLESLIKSGAKQVILLGSPPPKEDDSFCRERLAKEPAFVERAEKLGVSLANIPLSTPLRRYKYWAVLQLVMREAAERQSAVFQPSPKEASTGDGFLLKEYWAEDVTHANKDYGKLVLQTVASAGY